MVLGGEKMSERRPGFQKKNKNFVLDMLGVRCLAEPAGKTAK